MGTRREAELSSEQLLGVAAAVRLGEPDPDRAMADRSLQFRARPFGDQRTSVDDGDAVGECIRFVQVLRGQQHGRPFGGDGADDVPDLPPTARVEAGRRLVEKQQVGSDDKACGDVEAPPHAAGERLDLPAAGLAETERVEQLGRSLLCVAPE